MTNLVQIPLDELQRKLGQNVRRLRLAQNLSIESVATSMNIAEKSVRNLESGCGSTTETLFKVLTALDSWRVLNALCPAEEPPKKVKGVDVPPRRRARRTATVKKEA